MIDDLSLTEIQSFHQGERVSQGKDMRKIEEAVEAAELKTGAEFVVALEPRCGSYRDLDLLFSVGVAFAYLLYAFFAPWTIHQLNWLPFNLGLVFALGWLVSSQTRFIRRLLAGSDRRKNQVQEAAQLLFYKHGQ